MEQRKKEPLEYWNGLTVYMELGHMTREEGYKIMNKVYGLTPDEVDRITPQKQIVDF